MTEMKSELPTLNNLMRDVAVHLKKNQEVSLDYIKAMRLMLLVVLHSVIVVVLSFDKRLLVIWTCIYLAIQLRMFKPIWKKYKSVSSVRSEEK